MLPSGSFADLLEGICEAKHVIDLFLNNKIEQAKERINVSGKRGMYQELAHSTVLFVQGTATIDQQHLQTATNYIRVALTACRAKRRRVALADTISKQMGFRQAEFYKDYTEEQAHAELCYAEGLLQAAFLNMLQDEKLTTLIKNSMKIRQCYKCYRICWRILKHKEWTDGVSKSAFESGVRLGVGAFNLMISLLPKGILNLLEFVGYAGDRKFGLQQLRMGAEMHDSLRAPLCALLLLVYDLYASQMLGDTVSSISFERPDTIIEAKNMLSYWRGIYPKSCIFLLLAGKAEETSGDLDKAIEYFNESVAAEVDWAEYKHILYWELMWCHALRAEWLRAVSYAERLACESQWSQATYRYMKAAFLLQYLDDPGVTTPISHKEFFPTQAGDAEAEKTKTLEHIDQLLVEIPKLMHRFAGRSLPLEKIALRKSKRYFSQKKKLTLPALELLYIWNGFKLIQFQQDLILTFLLICENKVKDLLSDKAQMASQIDDYCLALLLKGVCLRCRGQRFQATMCFNEVLEARKKLKVDTYLIPFCEMELCQVAYDEDNLQLAMQHLNKAAGYKNYNLQSRLHFRIHEMESRLRDRLKDGGKAAQSSSGKADTNENSQKASEDTEPGSVARETDAASDLDTISLQPGLSEFDEDEFDVDIDEGLSRDQPELTPT